MTREIIIDEDTKVGYGFQSKQFFVDNKGTRTTRKGATIEEGAKQTKRVLDIVAPDNTITWQDLQSLAETPELITSLSCTYEDSGAFVKTITLNDYDYYPIVLDCPLRKLYIMNTDKVYDLTLNVDPQININDLISFYELTLGLDYDDLSSYIPSIYSFFLSWYNPHVYNHISPRKNEDTSNPLYYSDSFSLSNYSGSGYATYTCTINPDKILDTSGSLLGNVIGLDTDNKLIQLINTTEAFENFPETEDRTVIVNGLSEKIGSDTYSADGKYTMVAKDLTNKTMTVQEAITFNYSFPYPKVYLQYPNTSITSVNNTDASIVVSSATGFNVGQTLSIYNSLNNVNDGEYTIIGISENTISLDTVPPVSMESNCGNVCVLTYVGEATSIETTGVRAIPKRDITFREPTLVEVASGRLLKVGEYWSCSSSSSYPVGSTSIGIADEIDTYTPSYPTLSYNKLAEIVNINVTSSILEELPEGEFNVDTYEQCQEYIGLGDNVLVPTDDTFEDANKQVPDNIHFEQTGYATLDITVRGLYSEYYS